jgi:hypothetical protein
MERLNAEIQQALQRRRIAAKDDAERRIRARVSELIQEHPDWPAWRLVDKADAEDRFTHGDSPSTDTPSGILGA